MSGEKKKKTEGKSGGGERPGVHSNRSRVMPITSHRSPNVRSINQTKFSLLRADTRRGEGERRRGAKGARLVIYRFTRRRETKETEGQREKWQGGKGKKTRSQGKGTEGGGGEHVCTHAATRARARARECKHTTPRAGRWKWATGEVKAGRWRRSLQFSARRPLDRSNANNVADANCR